MKIDKKKINDSEYIFYFPSALPIIGSFYTKETFPTENKLLKNIMQTGLAEEVLLTSDFIYIKAKNIENAADLELLSLAEIDDYYNPDMPAETADIRNTETKIKIILKNIVAPRLQHDGGDIEFISYQNNNLTIRFLGNCQNCPYAQKTLQNHVAKNLMRYLPQIKEIKLL